MKYNMAYGMTHSRKRIGWDSLTKKPRIKINYTKQYVEVVTPFGSTCYHYKGKPVNPLDLVRDLIAYYTKLEKPSVSRMREEVREIVRSEYQQEKTNE